MSDSDLTARRPRRHSAVAFKEVGQEAVLAHMGTGRIHVLNPTASLLWQCFDGESSIEEIVMDLEDGFGVPAAIIRDDVLTITNTLGDLGLLDGVEPAPSRSEEVVSLGLPEGELVRLPDRRHEGGADRILLVNWSSGCGYCLGILPDLAAMQGGLASAGVDIVLIESGDSAGTKRLLEQHNVVADVLPTDCSPFAGMGTPVAYLLDEESKVASRLAYGSGEVIGLARSVVQDVLGGDDDAPRFLPAMGGACGSEASSSQTQTWCATRSYRVGDYLVGLRANSSEAEEMLAAALGHYRLAEEIPVPCNFSVMLTERTTRGRRDLNVLLAGATVVARSRSPLRILTALAGHLGCLLGPPPGLLRVDSVGAVVDGLGLLLPKEALSSLVMVQRSLSEHGITLINEPFAHIDPVRLELVVLEPRVSLDEAAVSHLRTLTAGPPESAPASPGRYALRYWLHGVGGEGSEELSQGAAVARSLGAVVAEPGELADLVDPITRLVAATRVEVVPIDGPTELIHRIRNWRRVA